MKRSVLLGLMMSAWLGACGGDSSAPSDTGDVSDVSDTRDASDTSDVSDASDVSDTSDTEPDTSDVSDTGDTSDTSDVSDTEPDTTVPNDTADTDVDDGDSSGDDAIAAVIGGRCALSDRVAQIDVEAIGNGIFYLNGWVTDRPDPWFGAPELTDGACRFFRFDPAAACPPCEPDELCSVAGECVPAPAAVPGAIVTLAAGGDSQAFSAADESGILYGQVTLAGDRFALALAFGDTRVTVAEMTVPGPLANLTGTLEGDYDAPTRLALAWDTAGLTDSSAYTRIPINHHAGGPTFTECALPATTGALEVGEAMLKPLAVITGLEFQGLDHVRFAAAETPAGCVEIRFLQRNYVGFF